MKLTFEAATITELRMRLCEAAHELGAIAGLADGNAALKAQAERWEQARQQGYSQGFNAGFGEACDRAHMDKTEASNEAGPEQPDVAQQQSLNLGKPYGDPREAMAEQAEANRKVAVTVGAERERYYASMSSPETVAKTLGEQHRSL